MIHSLLTIDGVVGEITRIHRSLPPRPSIDEVEAATALVRNVAAEEQSRLDAIARQRRGIEIPEELFTILQEMQKSLVLFQSREQQREAVKLLDLENTHKLFDELIQRASSCVPSGSNGSSFTASSTVTSVNYTERESERVTRDDSYVKKPRSTMYAGKISDASLFKFGTKPDIAAAAAATGGGGSEKLSLIKLASLIEAAKKSGARELVLQNKLSDQIDWIPDSIGKLSDLLTLDLSENRIVMLPAAIGLLSSLTKLDLHSNLIAQLPDAIGDLSSLLYLDLRANQLTTLPATFGKLAGLEELDLSSNRLSSLPDEIGNLTSLKKLNIETNDIEELPYTIGQCVSLVVLQADYNRLKCLPEAIGRLECLEILSVRYNNIKGLPTTVASMFKLKEVDLSFNELESIPEGLCLATSLVKLNVGNNFADLRYLPRSIGNLEMLEELDMSNNQIRALPDSFGMLSRLRVLRAEENPLEVPPRQIIEKGAQAVVQYMAELVAKRDAKPQPVKTKNTWAHICFFSRPNKRKYESWTG